MLQIRAIEGDVVGDAIDDDGVLCRLVEVDGARFDKLCPDSIDIAGINMLD
jgi:hypothetical protein